MVWLFVIIVGGAIGLIALISLAIRRSVAEMSQINQLPVIENEPIRETDLFYWATSHDFHYLDTFLMQIMSVDTFVAVWQHQYAPTFLAAYICQRKEVHEGVEIPVTQETAYEFVTYFEKEHLLTTSSTPSANLFPLEEGVYRQTLNFKGLDDLYMHHNQAVTYLKNFGNARLGTLNKQVDHYIIEALHACTDYVKSLPLWPLRGAYWYFIRRHLWHNLIIEKQHEKRRIKLPNELESLKANKETKGIKEDSFL